MKLLLEHAINQATKAGASYVDARFSSRDNENIAVRNGNVSSVSANSDTGIGIRVLANGAWGFASSSIVTKEEVAKVAIKAVRIAKASARQNQTSVTLAPQEPVVGSYRTPYKVDPFDVKLEHKLDLLLEAEKLIRKAQKKWHVASRLIGEANLNCMRETKYFATSEGTFIEQEIVESGGGISATAGTLGEIQRRAYPNAHRGHYQTAGWEFVESLHFSDHAERIGQEARALLKAKKCPSTETTVIIDGTQMALQVHESIGHPIELDRVYGSEAGYAGTSFLTPEKRNTFSYGSENVNITADATIPHGLGTYGFDDEGVPAQRVDIIKEGKFQNYLTSRETAALIGDEHSNGCMRASGWNRLPIIRMSNVNLEPGDWTLDEMIRDTKEGIFMETNRSWSIDDKRLNFHFGTEIGWEIKDGALGRMIKSPTYTGITPEFWASCDAIADKNHWTLWGTPNCGKGEPGQTAHVGHGTSPARFRNVKVGVPK